MHFEAARFSDARRCFEASLALAPGRPSVLLNLGVTCFRMSEWANARDYLQEASLADPNRADSYAYLGLTYEALMQWRLAVESLLQALKIAPGHADLWLALGRCQLRLGDAKAGLAAFDHAIDADPNLAEAWSNRGSLLRELNRFDEAAVAFEKALSLGADPELHGYYLASVRGTNAPPAPPRRYVETLFDSYAVEFQEHLVGELDYQVPQSLMRPLLEVPRRYASVLDLGCGSGLLGQLVAPVADAIDGVDLSRAMLAQARKRGVYGDLIHADLVSFLAQTTRRAELVLAADVFIYLGELSAVFASVRRILEPGGCFAFSVELLPQGRDFELLPSLRYAHSQSYIHALSKTSGFRVRESFTGVLRKEQGRPVLGLYAYLE
jgi:predicted TPR repeat methyltransferase